MAIKIVDEQNKAHYVPEAYEVDKRIKELIDKHQIVITYDSYHAFPSVGDDAITTNKIYRAKNTGKCYYWNSTNLCYVEITLTSTSQEQDPITQINGGDASGSTFDNNN